MVYNKIKLIIKLIIITGGNVAQKENSKKETTIKNGYKHKTKLFILKCKLSNLLKKQNGH